MRFVRALHREQNASSFNDATHEALGRFAADFKKNVIDQGKKGRRAQQMPSVVEEQLKEAMEKWLPGHMQSTLMIGAKFPPGSGCEAIATQAFAKSQFWAGTAVWETTHWEVAFAGSFRVTTQGSREVALMKLPLAIFKLLVF